MTSLFLILCLAWGAVYAIPVDLDYDCSGMPENFLYWWACGSYGICRGGRYQQVDCVNGTTYDRRTESCVPNSAAVSFPCNGDQGECQSYSGPGHRYPDQNADPVENFPPCTFYYTCSYGRYLGHQRCSLGTVYDENQQRCLPSNMVAPPCGTSFDTDLPINQIRVVQPITDTNGNPDYNRWPFVNSNNDFRPGAANVVRQYVGPPDQFGQAQQQRDYFSSRYVNAANGEQPFKQDE